MAKRKRTRRPTRARAIGRRAAGDLPSSAIAAATGVATFYVQKLVADNIEMARRYWWAVPAATAFGGHFLRQMNQPAGLALIGAAGYGGAWGFAAQQAAAEATGVIDPAADVGAFAAGAYEALPEGPFSAFEEAAERSSANSAMGL